MRAGFRTAPLISSVQTPRSDSSQTGMCGEIDDTHHIAFGLNEPFHLGEMRPHGIVLNLALSELHRAVDPWLGSAACQRRELRHRDSIEHVSVDDGELAVVRITLKYQRQIDPVFKGDDDVGGLSSPV